MKDWYHTNHILQKYRWGCLVVLHIMFWLLAHLRLPRKYHYSDVTISKMASQITGESHAYSAVCLGAHQKTSKLRVNGHCEGKPLVTGGFPSQRTSNAENVPFDDGIMLVIATVIILLCKRIVVNMACSHTLTTKFASDLGYKMAKKKKGLNKENTFYELCHQIP